MVSKKIGGRPACRRVAAFGVSLLALGLSTGAALATDSAPAATGDSSGLEEVVVSAQRRPTLERETPVAVTSINSDTLDAISTTGEDIRFLASRAPSLQAESSFGRTYPRFYIRGLGNSDFDPNASQPVSVVYDDVVLENPMLKAFPVFDMASVEVLNGPQGTLFGRNTPAGVVKLDSAKPTDYYTGYLDANYGTFNTFNAQGAVGGPLTENGKLKFRASFDEQRRDNYVHNTDPVTQYRRDFEGYTDIAGRLQLEYTGEQIDVLLNVHGRDLGGTARQFHANAIQQGTNKLAPGFDVFSVNQDGDNNQQLRSFGTDLRVNYDAGPVTLTSITGFERAHVFSQGDVDGGACDSSGCNVPFPSDTGNVISPRELSQELRVASNGNGPLTYQGGVYIYNEFLAITDYDFDASNKPQFQANHKDRSQTYGVYGSTTYKVTDDFTLGGGLRYSKDMKSVETIRDFSNVGGFDTPLNLRTSTQGGDVSWDVSGTYALTSDINVYARIATGYLAPSIQDRIEYANSPSVAKAETTISYEAGIKSALFNHRANFNVTGYYYDTSNMQLTAVGGATNSARLLNAKDAIGYGVETQLEAKPIDNLIVTTAASYNHTEIRDGGLSVAPCGAPCTVLNPINAQGNAMINGNPLPQAPQYIVSATARYGIPVGDRQEVYVFTDWSYRGTYNFFLYQATEFKALPFINGAFRLGYKNDADGYEIAGYVRNALNQVRAQSAIDFNNLTAMVNDPRVFGVDARFSF